jgi:hypothetical protein
MESIKLTLNIGKSIITLTLTSETQRIQYNSDNYLNSDNLPNSNNHSTRIPEATPPIIRPKFNFDSGDPMYMV